MRAVPIRWEDLETAFERNAPDTESWLDLRSGGVVTIIDGEPDAPIKRGEVSASPSDYLRIDAASSREQYRWMEHFVGSVTEPALRERLVISIDGKGAFRRFKNVLLSYPAERERWFTYRSELLRYQMQQWLEEKQIEASVPPPWGRVDAPKELEEPLVRPTAPTGEAPGEALRRQARELIDSIPAIDLPTAITFLEFIRERGAEEVRPARRKDDAAPERGDRPDPDRRDKSDKVEAAPARPSPEKPPVSLVGGTRS